MWFYIELFLHLLMKTYFALWNPSKYDCQRTNCTSNSNKQLWLCLGVCCCSAQPLSELARDFISTILSEHIEGVLTLVSDTKQCIANSYIQEHVKVIQPVCPKMFRAALCSWALELSTWNMIVRKKTNGKKKISLAVAGTCDEVMGWDLKTPLQSVVVPVIFITIHINTVELWKTQ